MIRKAVLFFMLVFIGATLHGQDFNTMRDRMVSRQIRARGITRQPILTAMEKVERHRFVPDAYQEMAYDDGPLPIGYGQTISQPYIVAYMTDIIDPQPGDRVLEIGTGSGYQAAILAELVEKVVTIEIIPELGNTAKKLLEQLGYDNVEVIIGDGYNGWKAEAPYDAIIVTSAAAVIPPPLLEQLKEGGRMVIPVGSPSVVQTLMLVEKKGAKTITRSLLPVRFVPFKRAQ